MKDGEPLKNSPNHFGVHTDILFISNTSQGTEGSYACYITQAGEEVLSDIIAISVKSSPMKEHFSTSTQSTGKFQLTPGLQ